MFTLRDYLKWMLAATFIAVGFLHFVRAERFVKIVPPYLPWHAELVYISGVFEVLGGIGLLIPRTQVVAAWGLIALLVAVFPANVHMALHPEVGAELFPHVPPFVWWVRLPLQAALIAWAYWFTTE